jgi:cytochrome c-type biogenesis protein
MGFTVSIELAFLTGLASFLSPCVFSLVPAYISYLGGRAAGSENMPGDRLATFTHGLAFVLGFSVVFASVGVTASFLGNLLYGMRTWIARIGGTNHPPINAFTPFSTESLHSLQIGIVASAMPTR